LCLALALLRTACVRAKGALQSMDISGVAVAWQDEPFVHQWLDSVSAANKAKPARPGGSDFQQ